MPSYNAKQKGLLLKAYKADAERTLNIMRAALNRGDVKGAAALGLYDAVPTIQRCFKLKAELRQIQRRQDKTRKQAKHNLYPGGSLYTGENSIIVLQGAGEPGARGSGPQPAVLHRKTHGTIIMGGQHH